MAQTIADYIAFNGRAIGERRIGTHLQGSDRGQMRVVSGHLPGWLAETHKQLHNSWCKGQSSILSPVKWKSEALPLGIIRSVCRCVGVTAFM
jgi:hypothetical protein